MPIRCDTTDLDSALSGLHAISLHFQESLRSLLRESLKVFIEGIVSGSAPTGSSYWYYNALIYLADDLSSQLGIESAVTEALEFGCSASNGSKAFNVVLISIRQIVLIYWNGKTLQRTEAMPLLHMPADSDADVSTHCEISSAEARAAAARARGDSLDCEDSVRTVRTRSRIKEKPEEDLDASFSSLMHLLRNSTWSRLPSHRGTFPTEIYEMIVGFMDIETMRQCTLASQILHDICQRNLLITSESKLPSYDETTRRFQNWKVAEGEAWRKDRKDFYVLFGFQSVQPSFSGPYNMKKMLNMVDQATTP